MNKNLIKSIKIIKILIMYYKMKQQTKINKFKIQRILNKLLINKNKIL
jgi:hypothetical protein